MEQSTPNLLRHPKAYQQLFDHHDKLAIQQITRNKPRRNRRKIILPPQDDFILNDECKNNMLSLLNEINVNNYDCFYSPCKISGINTIYPIPQLLPIKKLVDYNSKIITNPKEFIDIMKFQICEEYLYNFYKTLTNPLLIAFEEYPKYFPNIKENLSSSGTINPFFYGLNSGVFIDKNDRFHWVFSIYNGTIFPIDYICKLYFCGNEIQTYQNRMGPEFWHYNSISKNIINEILDSDKCLDVYEKISYGDGNKEIFEYKINKKNLESISKAKVFYYY